MSDLYRTKSILLSFLPVFFLIVIYYWPALFGGMTQAHGDSIFHGLAMLELHQDYLSQWRLPLWVGDIYGGHPVLAEGHVAFFNPLMLLTSALAEPVYGQNLFHVLSLGWGASGVVLICLHRGRSPVAAGTAALIVTFSSLWLEMQNNITVAGSLAWAPWAFWAMERWVSNRSPSRGALLALFLVAMLFGGYPQVFHAFICCAVVAYIPELPRYLKKRKWLSELLSLSLAAMLVVVLCCLLAAFYLLPLFELTSLSHRSDGVDLFHIPAVNQLRGIVYAPPQWNDSGLGVHFAVVGCVTAVFLAFLAFCWRLPPRETGYALAMFFLTALGLGGDSAFYNWVLSYNLVPGLGFFRLTYVYLHMAIICLALLGAFAIDRLSASPLHLWRLLVVIVGVGAGLVVGYFPGAPRVTLVVFGVLAIVVVKLVLIRRQQFVGAVILFFLVVELIVTRIGFVNFVPLSALTQPENAVLIKQSDNKETSRVFEHMSAKNMTFISANSPHHKEGALLSKVLNSLQADTNLLWGISSIQGAHALPLQRRQILDQQFVDEIDGASSLARGQRLIDYLNVGYVTAKKKPRGIGFKRIQSRTAKSTLYRNTAVRPRIQLFDTVQWVETPQQALVALQTATEELLVLESDSVESGPRPARLKANSTATLVHDSGDELIIDVQASQPLWLFIADANYPGWQAALDGVPTPLHSAQVLGKAVYVPAGSRQLRVFYQPTWMTLAIALTSLGIVLFALAIIRRDRDAV